MLPAMAHFSGNLPSLVSSPKLLGEKGIWKGKVFIARITCRPKGVFFPGIGEHGID